MVGWCPEFQVWRSLNTAETWGGERERERERERGRERERERERGGGGNKRRERDDGSILNCLSVGRVCSKHG